MRASNLNIVLFASFFAFVASTSTQPQASAERTQKHFSLFSVVTFKNEECTSESSLAGGARAGTCYTNTECSDKSGMKSGNCASGFGVCCVFLQNSGASATVSENRTYLRNAEFPAVTTATAAVSIAYTLNKMSSDICQIRLDFVAFVLAGPANSLENIPGTTSNTNCQDSITFVQTGGAKAPPLCGVLTGEHIYLDLGFVSTDTSVVTVATAISTTIAPTVALRLWDIKTSQIECYATYRAPAGCHRYFTEDSGKIISYNFMKVAGSTPAANGQNSGQELASQEVNTCIRRNKGMGCVQYMICNVYNGITLTELTGTAGDGDDGNRGRFNEAWTTDLMSSPWLLDATEVNAGLVDGLCSGDYVEIPSSWSGACGGGHGGERSFINTRYCGARLGANFYASHVSTTHSPVCDCSEPFLMRHYTDLANDTGGRGAIGIVDTNTNVPRRGVCLDFQQRPAYA